MKLEQIWADYKRALKAFIHSKVDNPTDVDDLLQDILVKTYKNLDSIKEKASIKAWLFQIANNSIIDFYRRKGATQLIDEENLLAPKPEKNIMSELSTCILPFINALPEENARLLIAIDIENQSQKTYAEKLGVSYSTLKSRVQKSRALLKMTFDNCCHFQMDKNGNLYDYSEKPTQCRNC